MEASDRANSDSKLATPATTKPLLSPKPKVNDVTNAAASLPTKDAEQQATSQPNVTSCAPSSNNVARSISDEAGQSTMSDDAALAQSNKVIPDPIFDAAKVVRATNMTTTSADAAIDREKPSGIELNSLSCENNDKSGTIAADLAERPSQIYVNVWVPPTLRTKKPSKSKSQA